MFVKQQRAMRELRIPPPYGLSLVSLGRLIVSLVSLGRNVVSTG
jgi:hypothetical protein